MNLMQLVKKDQEIIVSYVKDHCHREMTLKELTDLLDFLLNPNELISDINRIECFKLLISKGIPFEEFAKLVNVYNNSTTCGLVWTSNYVAYRCRTCAISPCMSLCAECFHTGSHTGHDFNMFTSMAGGACDCGDEDVLDPKGFCPKHGKNKKMELNIPKDLIDVAEIVIPRILYHLLQQMRENYSYDRQAYTVSTPDSDIFLDFLQRLIDMGAGMRTLLSTNLLCTSLYESFKNDTSEYASENYHKYFYCLKNTDQPIILNKEFPGIEKINVVVKHNTLLEELYFWMLKYKFYQKMVTFLLSMLPDETYKMQFLTIFTQHYSMATLNLANSRESPNLASRMVHISVQLLSPINLAMIMVQQHNLLEIMLALFKHLLDSSITSLDSNNMLVVDCSKSLMRDHGYWSVISDYINLLNHKPIVLYLLGNPHLIQYWANIITYFHGMNQNTREMNIHVEYEADLYYTSFTAELEICSTTMWGILSHLKDEATKDLTLNALTAFKNSISKSFENIHLESFNSLNQYSFSFHLPLHRYLSVFLSNGILKQNLEINIFPIGDTDFLKKLMANTLQLFAMFHEIHCGLWVRNGQQIRGQAFTYVQCHFCNSTIDADYFLLQLVASYIDPDYFMKMVFEAFHTVDILTFQNETAPRRKFLQKSQEIPMLESVLYFLAILFNTRTFSGKYSVGDKEYFRNEMVSMLAISDQTYSHLSDYLPDCIGNHFTESIENFESILDQVADFKAPALDATGTLQQGKYQLKGDLWLNEYNPLHVYLRAVFRKDYQLAHDRYTEFLKQNNSDASASHYWPPFRLASETHFAYEGLFRLFHCRSMHAFIFTILYKIVYVKNLPESIICLVIYLLEMAISCQYNSTTDDEIHERYQDREFEHWYASNDLYKNILTIIPQINTSYILTKETKIESDSDEFSENFEWEGDSNREIGILYAPQTFEIGRLLLKNFNSGDTPLAIPNVRTSVHQMKEAVPVNESILTLLLKIYTTFSNTNFIVPTSINQEELDNNRVGNGTIFLSKILTKICSKSEKCRKEIERLNEKENDLQTSKIDFVENSIEERRKKAKLRQINIMQDFARKQQRFISESSITDESNDITDDSEKQEEGCAFICCICNISSLPTIDRPICLISHITPTSVLGKRSTDQNADLKLDSIEDSIKFSKRLTFAAEYNFRKDFLQEHLEQLKDASLETGCYSGIHVQTCGHYLHVDCHESYVKSLQVENMLGSQSLLIDRGEFWCPICRQVSNVIMPYISDDHFAKIKNIDHNLNLDEENESIYSSFFRALSQNHKTPTMDSQLKFSVYKAVGLMLQIWQNVQLSKSDTLLPFSILRTNVELDILNQQNSFNLPTKKSCIKNLFKILSFYCDVKSLLFYWEQWSLLTGINFDYSSNENNFSVQVFNAQCPILMMDMSDNLVHFILALSSSLNKEYFTCLIQLLYNVQFIQCLILICCKMASGNLEKLQEKVPSDCCYVKELLLFVYGLMRELQLCSYVEDLEDCDADDVPAICEDLSSWSKIKQILITNINPFLKFSASIKRHIFDNCQNNLSELTEESTFNSLTEYLLISCHSENKFYLHWATDDPYALIRKWMQALYPFSLKHLSATRNILCRVRTWSAPFLMPLPLQFDILFQHYRRLRKKDCVQAAKNSLLCLLCANLVCTDKCCVVNGCPETYRHALECGSGTVMYIGIETSIIHIIDGPRLAQWGSVYLDKHGEEDRNLKRGKPLFLNKERYQILNKLWISHSLGTSSKNFVLHENTRLLLY